MLLPWPCRQGYCMIQEISLLLHTIDPDGTDGYARLVAIPQSVLSLLRLLLRLLRQLLNFTCMSCMSCMSQNPSGL